MDVVLYQYLNSNVESAGAPSRHNVLIYNAVMSRFLESAGSSSAVNACCRAGGRAGRRTGRLADVWSWRAEEWVGWRVFDE